MNLYSKPLPVHQILANENRIAELKKNYADLKNILSEKGNASAKAAQLIHDFTLRK